MKPFACFSIFILVALATACTSGRSEEDCNKIAADIRAAALDGGIPPQGACTNPSAPQLKPACDDLKKCNEEVD